MAVRMHQHAVLDRILAPMGSPHDMVVVPPRHRGDLLVANRTDTALLLPKQPQSPSAHQGPEERKAGQGAESGTGTILTRWGVLDYGSAMARTARVAPGGMVFHVLNRGVARMQLFEKAVDYQAFEQVLRDTLDQSPMRICAYAVMPNHWHLLLWPECDGELTAFMQRLTITHVRRWQEHRGYAGLGHVYQGRYKSFPVESDEHFWVVARYVERNALRANLVLRAEEWRWSSLWQRCHPPGAESLRKNYHWSSDSLS